jgi:hypothetical protein
MAANKKSQKSNLAANEDVIAYLGSMETSQTDLAIGEVSNDDEDFS